MEEENFQQKIKEVLGDWEGFLDKIFSNLEKTGFKLSEFKELDHIAYRTESLEGYEMIKGKMVDLSKKYSDKNFGGRPIMVCFLKEPLRYGNFSIEGIEILAPKENNKHKEGLEHAEFVTKNSLADVMNNHKETLFNLDAYNREENPELIMKFEDCAVKLHAQSLLEVRNLK